MAVWCEAQLYVVGEETWMLGRGREGEACVVLRCGSAGGCVHGCARRREERERLFIYVHEVSNVITKEGARHCAGHTHTHARTHKTEMLSLPQTCSQPCISMYINHSHPHPQHLAQFGEAHSVPSASVK